MIWAFFYYVKMVSARLKMLTLGVLILVFVMEDLDDYGVNPDETWMHGDWFYTTNYGIFGHEVKATERSPPDNHIRWIILWSKGFTRKGIENMHAGLGGICLFSSYFSVSGKIKHSW